MSGGSDPRTEPHAVLGVAPDATPQQIARAYRRLAKALHPDRAGTASEREMARLNAAYDLLRDGLAGAQAERLRAGTARAAAATPSAPGPTEPGAWLDPGTRRRLGRELTAALEPGEQVLAVADASMADSHDVRLAVTDRRLVWLRDDAISDRVRSQRHARIAEMDARGRGRLRRTGELRVRTDTGRRLAFGELAPGVAEHLLGVLRGVAG